MCILLDVEGAMRSRKEMDVKHVVDESNRSSAWSTEEVYGRCGCSSIDEVVW